MSDKSCFILGLPSAGKTTFLAALAYSVEQIDIPTKLRWPAIKYDSQYLTELAEEWLAGKAVNRTALASQQKRLVLSLEDEKGCSYDISFPDLSGETFQNYYEQREMEKSVAGFIEESDGIMLFFNPKTLHAPELIANLPLGLRESGQINDSEHQKMGSIPSVSNAPTEVQLVELLQFVEYIRDGECVNLTVVVSAWDTVRAEGCTPEGYVKCRLPLLWQYLYSNPHLFATKYFGVSAQGGEYGTEAEVEQLLAAHEEKAAERILVVDNQETETNDITLPLWATLN